MKTVARWPSLEEAQATVVRMQTKLHHWASDDARVVFDDLYNLVYDPAFLVVAWKQVRNNRGARSAGVDGVSPRLIDPENMAILEAIRGDLKSRSFRPLPVKERRIPKKDGKWRSLGIPTTRDRVVQASLKLVLEPIFEADFAPCSFGFRPGRRAQDAIADIHLFTTQHYEWVVEGDIEACFDNIDHRSLLERVRSRVGDKHVVQLIKGFLRAGVLDESHHMRANKSGTPQGGILSPLLANIALSTLDDHFMKMWNTHMATFDQRRKRRMCEQPNFRLVRYADDFVVLIIGTRHDAERLKQEVTAVLKPMGLTLSASKTRITHIDEGFDFLGFRIQRKFKRGSNGKKRHVYTWPSKGSFTSIKTKVKDLTKSRRNIPVSRLLGRLSSLLRGWATYFRHACSTVTFEYLGHFTWWRVFRWLVHRHQKRTWRWIYRRYLRESRIVHDGTTLFDPRTVKVVRYQRRQIPSPWPFTKSMLTMT